MRSTFDPEQMGKGFYRLLTSVVVPRPIAWVSTISADGVDNLAPHSFFTVACVTPPIVQFTSVGRKDTLRNVEATGEFVVNFCPVPLFEEVNGTGTDFPADVSEFDAIGLEREASEMVRPPRVAGSPAALECRVHSTSTLGDSTVVLGRVVLAVVDSEVIVDGQPDIGRLQPLSRLGGDEWGVGEEVRSKARISYRDWQGKGRF